MPYQQYGQKWQGGPKPGKRSRQWAACSDCDTCRFGGYKFYPLPANCLCGAEWKNAADRKAAKAHVAGSGGGGASGGGNGPKPKKFGNGSTKKPADDDPEEEAHWKAACDNPILMPSYKRTYGENSKRFQPVVEESPATLAGRLALEVKNLEEKVEKLAKKSANHSRVIDEHIGYRAEAEKQGAEAQLELEDKREELQQATAVNPRAQFKLPGELILDPEAQEKLKAAPELAELKAQYERDRAHMEALCTQLNESAKAIQHGINNIKAAEPPAAGAPAAEATPPQIIADPENLRQDAEMAGNSLEQQTADAEAEKKAKVVELERKAHNKFRDSAIALKKARTEATEAKKLADERQGG